MYRELGENFTQKMKKATNGFKPLPGGHNIIGFSYRGYDIHLKPYLTYLFFYIVNDGHYSSCPAGWDELAVYYKAVACTKQIYI